MSPGKLEQREIFFGAPSENQLVLIPLGTFDKYYAEREKEFLQFLCLADSPEEVERGMEEARELLRRRRRLSSEEADNFAAFASNQMLDIWAQASSGISLLLSRRLLSVFHSSELASLQRWQPAPR